MAKISHHFRLDENRVKELERLVTFYTTVQKQDEFLPPKKMTKTDIVEFLIMKEFNHLKDSGYGL